jgi:hypothetical protein
MFEGLPERIVEVWTQIQSLLHEAYISLIMSAQTALDKITSLEPTQKVVLWIQLFVGLLTVVWIIFQFAWLRRLNEARLERHLESTISTERDELADERTTTLAELDRVVKSRGLRRLILFVWAHIRLTLSLIMRLLSFGTTRGLADHNLLLMKVGAEQRARSIYAEVAREAIKKIKLYKDAIENKTLEAQNALIFAGRVALVERRTAAAVLLFRSATSLRDDMDARLLIGQQMAAAGAFGSARTEYQVILDADDTDGNAATKAEAHRAISDIHAREGYPGRARTSLGDAERIDTAHQNYAGLARTHDLVGDLYAPNPNRKTAALTRYDSAAENYDLANMPDKARAVRRKRDRLDSGQTVLPDGWWTRTLERSAGWLLRQAEKRRARARTRAA